MFITFEGCDYAGKSTQIKLLAHYLEAQKHEVCVLRDPGGPPIAEAIRGIFKSACYKDVMRPETELLLVNAARSQLVAECILPALIAKKVVLCDRYFDSTMAYQGYGRGLDLEDCWNAVNLAIGGVTPDLTLLLDISPEERKRRMPAPFCSLDRLEQEGDLFFKRVREGYLDLAKHYDNRIMVIDGAKSMLEVHTSIRTEVDILFSRP